MFPITLERSMTNIVFGNLKFPNILEPIYTSWVFVLNL
jgi:hypothetical protein